MRVCGAMICKRGEFITERHNELSEIEANLLNIVCNDVETEPVLQNISGELLSRGYNTVPEERLHIHAHVFWENQRSAFFGVRVCHSNALSYRDFQPQQIYNMHKNERRRLYSRRVLDMEDGTFTPLFHNRRNR